MNTTRQFCIRGWPTYTARNGLFVLLSPPGHVHRNQRFCTWWMDGCFWWIILLWNLHRVSHFEPISSRASRLPPYSDTSCEHYRWWPEDGGDKLLWMDWTHFLTTTTATASSQTEILPIHIKQPPRRGCSLAGHGCFGGLKECFWIALLVWLDSSKWIIYNN